VVVKEAALRAAVVTEAVARAATKEAAETVAAARAAAAMEPAHWSVYTQLPYPTGGGAPAAIPWLPAGAGRKGRNGKGLYKLLRS